jgi:DNA-binding IclR family transcriptional regulator
VYQDRVVRGKLPKLTGATVTRAGDLRRRLAEIRRTGISINRGERREDIAALAAPIFNASAECVAAVSTSGPRSRLTEECMEDFAKHVRKAAEEISLKLGHRAEP